MVAQVDRIENESKDASFASEVRSIFDPIVFGGSDLSISIYCVNRNMVVL